MTKPWFAVSVLALSLGATSGGIAAWAHATPAPSPAPSQPQYEGQGRWDEPPAEYRDAQRQGFRDGIEAARHDFYDRRHKDPDDHGAYRHPRVERELVHQYRDAFKEGYSRAMHHLREHGDQRRERDDQPHF